MPAEIAQPSIVVRPRAQTGFLVPSLSDFFYLFFTAWMFLVSPVGWQRLLLDADTALHTRIGQYILSSGTIPHQDLFSYTKPGQAWYAFEWLSETLFGLIFNLASYKGLVLLAGTMIALYVTLLLKYTMWRGANGMIALVVTLMAASATSVHFYVRPHLFTLLLLTISLWILEDHRRHGGRLVWILVPLTTLWANLHGGFSIFLVLLVLRTLGTLGEAVLWTELRESRKKETALLAALSVACGLASLLNPYGYGLHRHIVETLSSPWTQANVAEFLSPDFRTEETLHFMALLFAGLACIVPLVRKKSLVEPLAILFLAYSSLISVRHLTIFVLVAAPIIAGELSGFWKSVTEGQSKASLLGTLAGISETVSAIMPGTSWFIPAVIVVLAVAPGIPWPTAFPEEGVPVSLIETHHEMLATARVFAPDQVGDFLIFRNYPRQRVFLDSRHNYYGAEVGDEYLALLGGARNWHELLAKYSVNALVIRKEGPLASLVRESGEWRSLGADDKFELFDKPPGAQR